MPAPSVAAEKPAVRAELAFEKDGERTTVVRCRAATPLKILTPRHAGTAAWACLSSHGGGLLSGDAVALSVDVGAGARAALVTQASTKIYPGRAGARQSLAAAVAAGGLLAVAPDPVVCFAGARYSQRQEFDLAPSAGLVVVDWLTSGRAACGERWRFDSYESRLAVRRGGRELLRDASRLDAEAGPLPGRLGRFDVLALALATGPLFKAGARRLLARTAVRPAARRAALVVSAAAAGADGVLFRLAAESFEDAARELRNALDFAWDALGDDPWSRRA
jgi:urease accessory protein